MPNGLSLPDSPRGVAGFPAPDLISRKKAPSRGKKPKKNVAFQLEDNHSDNDSCLDGDDSSSGGDTSTLVLSPKVKCYFGPLRPELSKEERCSMYYSKKDFKSFKKEAKKLAQLTDDEEAQALYVRTFLDLYQRAAAPQAEDTVSRVSVSDLACLPLATAPVRGLERHIFPGLVHDQKLVKQSVLKAQDKIPHSIERHIRARILASASAMLSRQARHLARTMAHADSIVALSIYRRTFLPQTSSSSSSSKHKKAPK